MPRIYGVGRFEKSLVPEFRLCDHRTMIQAIGAIIAVALVLGGIAWILEHVFRQNLDDW